MKFAKLPAYFWRFCFLPDVPAPPAIAIAFGVIIRPACRARRGFAHGEVGCPPLAERMYRHRFFAGMCDEGILQNGAVAELALIAVALDVGGAE
jgi:hypothetical protein